VSRKGKQVDIKVNPVVFVRVEDAPLPRVIYLQESERWSVAFCDYGKSNDYLSYINELSLKPDKMSIVARLRNAIRNPHPYLELDGDSNKKLKGHDDLFQFKTNNHRVIYFLSKTTQRTIIVSHCFPKKRLKTPVSELSHGDSRKAQCQHQQIHKPSKETNHGLAGRDS
jgi:hypothetical protein